MRFIPGSNKVENFFKKYVVAFTLVAMYQGIFGGMTMKNPPEKLKNLSEKTWFKLITLFSIAFSITRDIEVSIVSVPLFLAIIWTLRTPEERKMGVTI